MPADRRAMLALLILSGLIISLCMGLRQSLGLFMRPLTLDLGISAATFGFSLALQNIVWGLSQPFVGALADRHGARPVLVGTALMYAAGLALMAFSKGVPGALEIAGFLTGIGTAGTGFNTLYGVVFLSHQVGSFFGAWMGGLVFDWTGSYDAGWGALIVIGLAAFTLQWLMDDRPPPVRRALGAAVPAV